jgi:hypothetical protein
LLILDVSCETVAVSEYHVGHASFDLP